MCWKNFGGTPIEIISHLVKLVYILFPSFSYINILPHQIMLVFVKLLLITLGKIPTEIHRLVIVNSVRNEDMEHPNVFNYA